MAYCENGNAQLYYEDVGEGPAIITTHGVVENSQYWALPGVTDNLVRAGYRVISTDMRAHGRTRLGDGAKGYDVDTVAEDFGVIADHLGLEKFHLLSHATGGMAALHYAINHHDRLLSLLSTDTGSATLPTDEAAAVTDPDVSFEKVSFEDNPLVQAMAAGLRGQTWDEIHSRGREGAEENVFLNRMHAARNPEAAFAMLETFRVLGNPENLADFMTVFYDDPDPQIAGLRQISCPCLVLLGEFDVLFVKPSELLAREIPNVRHVVLQGLGHMTALEDPEQTSRELLDFLATVPGS